MSAASALPSEEQSSVTWWRKGYGYRKGDCDSPRINDAYGFGPFGVQAGWKEDESPAASLAARVKECHLPHGPGYHASGS